MKKILFCVGIGGLAVVAPTAWADEIDGLTLTVGAGITRDSNLFRTPEGAEDDDEIRDTSFGIKYNKAISLQKFTVDTTVTDYNYRDNSYLDYRGKDLKGLWEWMATPALYGNLSATRTEMLNSFVDFVATTPESRRNIRTTNIRRFDVEWEATPAWHLLSGVTHTDVDNSLDFLEEDNYSADAGEVGVKFVSAKGNSIALVRRDISGSYDRPPSAAALRDSGFEEINNEVRLLWQLTGKTGLKGRAAYIERRHDTFAERDYEGWTGNIDLNWAATGKLGFTLGARRALNSYQETRNPLISYSSYYVGDIYSFGPVWQMTDKLRLSASYGIEDRQYRGTIVNGVPLRDDSYTNTLLQLEWQALRGLSFNLGYYGSERDSNYATSDFSSRMYTFSVLFEL